MSSKYHYYPTTSSGRSKAVDRDHDRASRYDLSDHSEDVPSLSRASTPSSFSSPPTPTLTPVLPTDSKMRGRHVEFASPVSHSYRRAEGDELAVMRAFASHASHCDSCDHSLQGHRAGSRLCDRGTGLAKDLGTYFYCYDGKPHANGDRRLGREKVQVEVPMEYGSVKGLFAALDKGLKLKRPKPSRPEIHQSSHHTSPSRPSNPRRYTMDSYPSQSHRRYLDHEDYDIRPSRSDSRRLREPVYRMSGGRYVDERPPYREEYAEKHRPRTPPSPVPKRTSTSKYSSGITGSELRHLAEGIERRRSRRYSDGKDRHRSDDRYPRFPRRRDSFDDRLNRRRSGDHRRRSTDRHYSSDDEYRKPKRSSSYFPFSSLWR